MSRDAPRPLFCEGMHLPDEAISAHPKMRTRWPGGSAGTGETREAFLGFSAAIYHSPEAADYKGDGLEARNCFSSKLSCLM